MTSELRIQGLYQVAQPVTDLSAAIDFYRDILGLQFVASFDPPGLAFFDLNGSYLFLDHADPRGERLTHHDATGQFGPAGEEIWMVFFKDPSGNLLALTGRKPHTS